MSSIINRINYIFFDLGNTLIDMSISKYAFSICFKPYFKNNIDGSIESIYNIWEESCYNIFSGLIQENYFLTVKEIQVKAMKNVFNKY